MEGRGACKKQKDGDGEIGEPDMSGVEREGGTREPEAALGVTLGSDRREMPVPLGRWSSNRPEEECEF